MADKEKIQGNALLQLFTELQMDETPLKMLLPNGDGMQLTYISDICIRKKAPHFLINSPAAYGKLSEMTDHSHLKFEFTDIEDIKYVFVVDTWDLSRTMIWIKLPEFVHRYQRRKLFRLEAPHGTRLYFKVNNIHHKLLVIDVSLGGTLGVLVSLTNQMEQEFKPYNLKMLENVELKFPSKDLEKAESIVKIRHCQIIRQERNSVTNKFECAIEIKKISEAEQKKLKAHFYKWQRDYLQKRKHLRA
jgi:c-di-GMP-binding flagellar brake protein YcgR